MNLNSKILKQLIIAVIAGNIIIIALVGATIYQSYCRYKEAAIISGQNLSKVLEENINGVLSRIDLALLTVQDEVEKELSAGILNGAALNAYIERQRRRVPELDGIRMTDDKGYLIYGTDVKPKEVNIVDRDYFVQLRDEPKHDLFIAKPVIGRISGQWQTTLIRRVNYPDGSFAGLVLGTLTLEKISNMLSKIDIGQKGSITLFHEDMSIIVRYPNSGVAEHLADKQYTQSELAKSVKRGYHIGSYTTRSAVDGVERTVSYRKVSGYPLYVVVGLAKDDYLSGWVEETTKISGLAAIIVAISICSAWLFYRRLITLSQASIVDSSSDAIVGTSPDGVITSWNAGAEKLYGYMKAEAIGRSAAIVVPASNSDEIGKLFEQISSNQVVDNYETLHIRKDGGLIDVSLTMSPIKNSKGKIMGASAIARDITDRKRSERALIENEARLRSFSTATFEGIVESESGRIVDCNEQFAQMSGYSLEELRGLRIEDLIVSEDREKVLKNITDNREAVIEHGFLRKNGTTIVVEARGRPSGQSASKRVTAVRDISERKATELQIKRLNDDLRCRIAELEVILDTSPIGLAIAEDTEGLHIRGNKTLAELTGLYSAGEFSLRSNQQAGYSAFRDGRAVPVDLLPMQRACRGESVSGEILDIVRADGSTATVYSSAKPILDNNGQPRGAVGAFLDITDRKQAEAAIRRERDLLQAVMNGAKRSHLVYLDRNFDFICVNEAYASTCGYTPQEMVGKNHFTLYPHPENEAIFAHVRDTGQAFEVHDKPFEFPDQPERGITYWDWTLTPVRDTGGQVIGLIFSLFETTDRKRVEVALMESEKKYRSIIENLQDGYFRITLGGIITMVSPSVVHIYGVDSPADLTGTPTSALYKNLEDRSFVLEKLRTMGRVVDFETEALKKNGTAFPVSINAQYFYDEKGQIQGIEAFVRDITERKLVEKQIHNLNRDLALRNAELEQANKELESFIYSVSHDLRGPLRAISGFSQLLIQGSKGSFDDKTTSYLDRIHNAAAKMSQLVDDLLRLSRISRQDMIKTEVDLSKIASIVVADLREINPDRNVSVGIKDGVSVVADSGLMTALLTNLLGNAWKFSAKTDDARIEFGTLVEEGKAIYYVKDNGVGFNPEYADKMFLPFHRLHDEHEFEGTGIGLSIAERIIHRHCGRIWAEGEENKGATVFFTLG